MSLSRMRSLLPLLVLATAPVFASAPSPRVPAPTSADDRVLWALCLSGEGCQVCRSDLTHAGADAALAAQGLMSRTPGHILVTMRKADGEWSWYYDTRRPAPELDRYFGGAGRDVQGTCPTLPGDIQPRDGTWTVSNGTPTATGCPAGVAERVATLQLMRGGPVVFAKPFRASAALPDPAVSWVQTAPNRHAGSFVPAGQTAMTALYALEVESETAMAGTLTVRVAIPGQARCRVQTPFRYTRTGD